MSYFAIKILAMIFMLIDHVGYILMGNVPIMRLVGRISFPLFAFLLVNGYHHTTDRKKYLTRMFVMALVSEMFYDLTFHRQLLDIYGQNVFFTLTVGLLSFIVTDKFKKIIGNKINGIGQKLIIIIGEVGILGCFMILNRLIRGDYSWYGIMLIYFLYLTYGTTLKSKFLMVFAIAFANFINIILANGVFQAYSILSITFIMFFEEKKVSVPKTVKIGCYLFYPIHLFVVFLIKVLM